MKPIIFGKCTRDSVFLEDAEKYPPIAGFGNELRSLARRIVEHRGRRWGMIRIPGYKVRVTWRRWYYGYYGWQGPLVYVWRIRRGRRRHLLCKYKTFYAAAGPVSWAVKIDPFLSVVAEDILAALQDILEDEKGKEQADRDMIKEILQL